MGADAEPQPAKQRLPVAPRRFGTVLHSRRRRAGGLVASDALDPFVAYLDALRRATNETQKRETFVALAASGFSDTQLATRLALGAEHQVRFEKAGLVRRGAVDAFFGNLVIEFEKDLAKTGSHAREQLRDYVAGAWTEDGHRDRPYLAVATDGNAWEVFTVTAIDPDGPNSSENVSLRAVASASFRTEADASDLRDFLNRVFFRESLIRPTAINFARDFGLDSPAYLASESDLLEKLQELDGDPQMAVLRREWTRSLQIAYGSVETPDILFVRHTYLAVLARLLVWAALERRHLESGEVAHVMSGEHFVSRGVTNIVEDDFFRWHTLPSSNDAAAVWVALSRHLAGYDLNQVREDVLKPLYEQLVDPETRHDLGEYYTPDWLAETTTEHLLSRWPWHTGEVPAVMDPTSGSGTFLRAVIAYMRSKMTEMDAASQLTAITSHVTGIDVHPLAVIIGRATFLLAIQDLIPQAKSLITVPVYLANSLETPAVSRQADLFGTSDVVYLSIEDRSYAVPHALVVDGPAYDAVIEDVMVVARAFGQEGTKLSDVKASLKGRLGQRLASFEAEAPSLVDDLGAMARQIANLIRRREDSVHGFMLRNHYRPAMLRHSVDYVVGNPPWLTIGDILEPTYKERVKKFCADTNVAPRGAGEQSHTELAAVFLAHAATTFLRPEPAHEDLGPRLGFVMPRSILTATQHRLVRQAEYGTENRAVLFDVCELWDLADVTPVFNIPSCVVFADSGFPSADRDKPGRTYRGRLPARDASLEVANSKLQHEDTTFELVYLGQRSTWRALRDDRPTLPAERRPHARANDYLEEFRQGAILYPQTLIVVDVQGNPGASGSVLVGTNAEAAARSKVLSDVTLHRSVDAKNLFLTASATHIFPYALIPPLWTVVLPTVAAPGESDFGPVSADELRRHGLVETASWLEWASGLWDSVRKGDDKTQLHERLDHLGQLSAQSQMRRYVVIYIAAGNRPMACAIDTAELDRPFVARDGTYWASFDTSAEAHFVTGFLNSRFAADRIVDWMNLGLFGPRHIHKRVLDVPLPRFDPADGLHAELADTVGRLNAEGEAAVAAVPNSPTGRQRLWLREQLSAEDLVRIEELVRKVSSQVT